MRNADGSHIISRKDTGPLYRVTCAGVSRAMRGDDITVQHRWQADQIEGLGVGGALSFERELSPPSWRFKEVTIVARIQ